MTSAMLVPKTERTSNSEPWETHFYNDGTPVHMHDIVRHGGRIGFVTARRPNNRITVSWRSRDQSRTRARSSVDAAKGELVERYVPGRWKEVRAS